VFDALALRDVVGHLADLALVFTSSSTGGANDRCGIRSQHRIVMPSARHQVLVELFRQSPKLATTLLELLHLETPANVTLRIDDSDLSTVMSMHLQADLVLLAERAKRARLPVIVEVQLSRKERKRLAWATYAVLARVRYRCSVVVLVVCPDARVARWARRAIEIGPGQHYAPAVMGPEEIPVITSVASESRNIGLVLLSAIAHAKSPISVAKPIILAALASCEKLPPYDCMIYSDATYEALGPALKEALMTIPEGYEIQSDEVKKWATWFAEGKAEGKAVGAADVLERQLAKKYGALPDQVVERLRCATLGELELWADRVLSADSLDVLFSD
jgi:hypothetical protein